ncbi:helix-hairpin-helix domain-containing protein [Haloechinothrix halophila]|uniref:helix-hairpin-helix domain-containing protein n=1 Tax=Haloechinothrix halophila TaxID=1069073 RepID=UPI000A0473DA
MFAQSPFVSKSNTVRASVVRARLSRLWEPAPPGSPASGEPPGGSGAPPGGVGVAGSSGVTGGSPTGPPLPKRTRLTRVAVAVGALSSVVTVALLLLAGGQESTPAPPLPLAAHDTVTTTTEPGAAGGATAASGAGTVSGATAAGGSTAASATTARLVVSVVGKVAEPGLVTVDEDARVADALEAAGGATGGANLATINLARKLSDGEQIYVDVPVPAGMTQAAAEGSEGATESRVDLNAATEAELRELPGVGEVTAQRIVEWRAEHGGFTGVEQLREVSGIGEQRLADLRERVTVAAAG